MTPFRHILHEQDAEGEWQQIADLTFVDGWAWAPTWLSGSREPTTIDWGTLRYEMTLAEVRRLIKPYTPYGIREDWDAPFIAAEARQNALFDNLGPDGRYAVDWQEGI